MTLAIWMTTLGVVCAYGGCVLLFQSGERRRRHEAVRIPTKKAALANRTGWGLVFTALVALSVPRGLEIGLTLWLAALSLGGMTSLLVSALAPRLHLLSPLAIAGGSIVLAIPLSLLGGTG